MDTTEAAKTDQLETPGSEEAKKETASLPSTAAQKGRFKRYLRSALIRALVGVALFAFGALVIFFSLYWPANQRLQAAYSDIEANQQLIQEHEAALAALQKETSDLENGARQADLNIALLRLQVDVMEARMAVAEQNFSRASLAIDRSKISLAEMAELLPDRHAPVVKDLQAKLAMADEKNAKDMQSALPDLFTLSGDLEKLKENLLLSP